MVELLGADKFGNEFGCEALIQLNGELLRVRFTVTEPGYMLLKKLTSSQPFESVAAGKYRYFFTGAYRMGAAENHLASIRVEQGRRHKRFEFALSPALMANLHWLQRIDRKEQLEG